MNRYTKVERYLQTRITSALNVLTATKTATDSLTALKRVNAAQRDLDSFTRLSQRTLAREFNSTLKARHA